jgi:hypothetical protein
VLTDWRRLAYATEPLSRAAFSNASRADATVLRLVRVKRSRSCVGGRQVLRGQCRAACQKESIALWKGQEHLGRRDLERVSPVFDALTTPPRTWPAR